MAAPKKDALSTRFLVGFELDWFDLRILLTWLEHPTAGHTPSTRSETNSASVGAVLGRCRADLPDALRREFALSGALRANGARALARRGRDETRLVTVGDGLDTVLAPKSYHTKSYKSINETYISGDFVGRTMGEMNASVFVFTC